VEEERPDALEVAKEKNEEREKEARQEVVLKSQSI
jgi:hypothetical protein